MWVAAPSALQNRPNTALNIISILQPEKGLHWSHRHEDMTAAEMLQFRLLLATHTCGSMLCNVSEAASDLGPALSAFASGPACLPLQVQHSMQQAAPVLCQ